LEKKKIINGQVLEKIRKAFKCSNADIQQIEGLTPPRKMNNGYQISLKSILAIQSSMAKLWRKSLPCCCN
jgi:hypothetical protein